MLYFLNKTERSLDVCLYLITVSDLCEEIIKFHKKGIKVRVITDEDMANGSGSQIHKFFQNGK
jgi:cardiolipin hydrolase